jgi:hypothetical protein
MLHAYVHRFDVTRNLEKFWELDWALLIYITPEIEIWTIIS